MEEWGKELEELEEWDIKKCITISPSLSLDFIRDEHQFF